MEDYIRSGTKTWISLNVMEEYDIDLNDFQDVRNYVESLRYNFSKYAINSAKNFGSPASLISVSAQKFIPLFQKVYGLKKQIGIICSLMYFDMNSLP